MIDQPDYWIDPKGKLHPVGFAEHNTFALKLLIDELGSRAAAWEHVDEIGESHPYQVLHKRGWIRVKYQHDEFGKPVTVRILGDCISMVRPMTNTMDPSMNERQMKRALMICEEIGYPFHNAINEKLFHL